MVNGHVLVPWAFQGVSSKWSAGFENGMGNQQKRIINTILERVQLSPLCPFCRSRTATLPKSTWFLLQNEPPRRIVQPLQSGHPSKGCSNPPTRSHVLQNTTGKHRPEEVARLPKQEPSTAGDLPDVCRLWWGVDARNRPVSR